MLSKNWFAASSDAGVFGEQEYPEDIRLRRRFLDLRRESVHANMMLRSKVIASLRNRMTDQGFTEFQTPILGAGSGRCFVVESLLRRSLCCLATAIMFGLAMGG